MKTGTQNSCLSINTVKAYEKVLNSKILPKFNNRKISDISKTDCENIIAEFRSQSLSSTYLRIIWTVIILILKYSRDENINWPFPEYLQDFSSENPQDSQSKLEKAIHENDASALMYVMMRENIPFANLIVLTKRDVNEKSCSIVIKTKAVVNKNSFEIKNLDLIRTVNVSKESMRIITAEISKHNALEKKFCDSYNNNDGFIFADEHGRIYKPSYYTCKFRQLSEKSGFKLTPKILPEFRYI